MSRKLPSLICYVLLVLSSAPSSVAADGPPLVVPVLGEQFAGQLVGVTEDWRVTFSTGEAERQFLLRQLVRWGNYSDRADGTQVLLSDGSLLPAKVLKLASESLAIDTKLWGEVSLPSALCSGVSFACSADSRERDRQWVRMQQTPVAAAHLFLRNGDEISGRFAKGREEDDEAAPFGIEAVNFIPQAGVATSFQVSQVQMLAFERRNVRLAPIACWLGLADGSLLAVSTLRRDDEIVEIELACGLQLRTRAMRMWQQMACIDSRQAEVTYLSDLRQADYRHFPFLSVRWPLGVDQNVLGGRLRSGGHVVLKGLGMHSTSRVVYDLDRRYSKLEAELALDDQAGRRGSARYRVLVERPAATARKWNLAYTSPIVRGSDDSIPISIDVADATRVALTVETADQGDTLDHANWLYARLVSAPETPQD
jgi:hypothetical protein